MFLDWGRGEKLTSLTEVLTAIPHLGEVVLQQGIQANRDNSSILIVGTNDPCSLDALGLLHLKMESGFKIVTAFRSQESGHYRNKPPQIHHGFQLLFQSAGDKTSGGTYASFRKLFKGLQPSPLFTDIALDLCLTPDLELLRICFPKLCKLDLDELVNPSQLASLRLCSSLHSLTLVHHQNIPTSALAAALASITSLTRFRVHVMVAERSTLTPSAVNRKRYSNSDERLLVQLLSISHPGMVVEFD